MRKHVDVAGDHLLRASKCQPEAALEELIWNGLDAGGERVLVSFVYDDLVGGSITNIVIQDFGAGLHPTMLPRAFGTVGNSLKRDQFATPEGRAVHGSAGSGRFKALALGATARWEATYLDQGKLWTYSITVTRTEMDWYDDTPPRLATIDHTGTVVTISNLDCSQESLFKPSVRLYFAEKLALYLTNYPGVSVFYDGVPIDPASIIERTHTVAVNILAPHPMTAELTIIEWNTPIRPRKLYLCDARGFAWWEDTAKIAAPDLEFTAYLKTDVALKLREQGQLATGELNQDLRELVGAAREHLKDYVRTRLAENARELIAQWRQEKVYPYPDDATQNPVERAERQVFDIIAAQLHHHHKPFADAETDSKKLTLHLMKEALENDPTSLRTIIESVVELPEEQRRELASLLEVTDLKSIIHAAKIVSTRLDTIRGFEALLFSREWRARLLERTQLHRLLVHELWIFGEEYVLDTDDETLREVLRHHLAHLSRDELAPVVDAASIKELSDVPDLMLSRRIRRPGAAFEHLVIELKRPTTRLSVSEITQVEQYAFSVRKDERFNTAQVRWKFVLIGNDFSDFGEDRARDSSRPYGCLRKEPTLEIWMLRWADVLNDARARYEFFRERLNVEASAERGLQYLNENYGHLLEGRGMTKKKEAAHGRDRGLPTSS